MAVKNSIDKYYSFDFMKTLSNFYIKDNQYVNAIKFLKSILE